MLHLDVVPLIGPFGNHLYIQIDHYSSLLFVRCGRPDAHPSPRCVIRLSPTPLHALVAGNLPDFLGPHHFLTTAGRLGPWVYYSLEAVAIPALRPCHAATGASIVNQASRCRRNRWANKLPWAARLLGAWRPRATMEPACGPAVARSIIGPFTLLQVGTIVHSAPFVIRRGVN